MPYFITDQADGCSGWAAVKDDGEVMGCHDTKQAAINQALAIAQAEGSEFVGERVARDAVEVGDFVSWNSSGGRARGRIVRIVRDGRLQVPGTSFTLQSSEDDPAALIVVYRQVRDGWEPTDTRVGHRFSTLTRIRPLPEPSPEDERQLPDGYRPATRPDVPEGRACGNCAFFDESDVAPDGRAMCQRWMEYVDGGFYCDAWEPRGEDRAVEFTVPQYVRDAAAQGLEFHREGLSGDGVVERTVREAAAMARGEVSEDKAVRVSAWAARHAVDLEAEGARPGEDGYPTPGAVAHLLWGIPTGAQYQDARAFWDNLAERIREQERYMITPVEARTEGSDVEFRMFSGELRAEGDGNTFVGYAAVFNSDSEPLPFTERIMPGAFGKSLRSRKRDIRAYINHDSNMVLASTRSGTLRLSEDDRGLRAEFELPEGVTYANDLRSLMRSGIVDKMSFGFTVPRGGDRWSEDGRTRELREVVLHEVSVVTGFPAYEGTTAAVRSLETLCERTGMSVDEIAHVLQRLADRPQETVEASAANLLELKRRQAELAAKKVV